MTIVAIVIFILAVFAVWIGISCEYDGFFTVGIGVIVCEAIIGISFLLCYYPAEYNCRKKAEMLGVEYKYDLIGGCFIRDEKGWFEYNQQRIVR